MEKKKNNSSAWLEIFTSGAKKTLNNVLKTKKTFFVIAIIGIVILGFQFIYSFSKGLNPLENYGPWVELLVTIVGVSLIFYFGFFGGIKKGNGKSFGWIWRIISLETICVLTCIGTMFLFFNYELWKNSFTVSNAWFDFTIGHISLAGICLIIAVLSWNLISDVSRFINVPWIPVIVAGFLGYFHYFPTIPQKDRSKDTQEKILSYSAGAREKVVKKTPIEEPEQRSHTDSDTLTVSKNGWVEETNTQQRIVSVESDVPLWILSHDGNTYHYEPGKTVDQRAFVYRFNLQTVEDVGKVVVIINYDNPEH